MRTLAEVEAVGRRESSSSSCSLGTHTGSPRVVRIYTGEKAQVFALTCWMSRFHVGAYTRYAVASLRSWALSGSWLQRQHLKP